MYPAGGQAGGLAAQPASNYLPSNALDAGRVIASGSPAELTRESARNTIRFTAAAGLDVVDLMQALPEGTKVEERVSGSYVVAGDVDPAMLATLTAWCAGRNVLAESILVERQTLEDRFLDLTGRSLR